MGFEDTVELLKRNAKLVYLNNDEFFADSGLFPDWDGSWQGAESRIDGMSPNWLKELADSLDSFVEKETERSKPDEDLLSKLTPEQRAKYDALDDEAPLCWSEDFQGSSWGKGRIETAKAWMDTALGWSDSDGEVAEEAGWCLDQEDPIEALQNFWDISITPYEAGKAQRMLYGLREAEEKREARPGMFTLGGESFAGYDDGKRWNGFVQPLFDKETAERVLTWFEREFDAEDVHWLFDNERNSFVLVDGEGEGKVEDEYAAENVDGKELFRIGEESWSWSEAEGKPRLGEEAKGFSWLTSVDCDRPGCEDEVASKLVGALGSFGADLDQSAIWLMSDGSHETASVYDMIERLADKGAADAIRFDDGSLGIASRDTQRTAKLVTADQEEVEAYADREFLDTPYVPGKKRYASRFVIMLSSDFDGAKAGDFVASVDTPRFTSDKSGAMAFDTYDMAYEAALSMQASLAREDGSSCDLEVVAIDDD